MNEEEGGSDYDEEDGDEDEEGEGVDFVVSQESSGGLSID